MKDVGHDLEDERMLKRWQRRSEPARTAIKLSNSWVEEGVWRSSAGSITTLGDR